MSAASVQAALLSRLKLRGRPVHAMAMRTLIQAYTALAAAGGPRPTTAPTAAAYVDAVVRALPPDPWVVDSTVAGAVVATLSAAFAAEAASDAVGGRHIPAAAADSEGSEEEEAEAEEVPGEGAGGGGRGAALPPPPLRVISAFKVPCVDSNNGGWCGGRRQGSPLRLDAPPTAKAAALTARYERLRARTLRNPRWAPPVSDAARAAAAMSAAGGTAYLQLTPIESLTSAAVDPDEDVEVEAVPAGGGLQRRQRRRRRRRHLVLGMLTQLEADAWYLEDPHGVIRLDLSAAVTTAGFFTEHSFVIVEGTLHAADVGSGGARAGGPNAMTMVDEGEPPPANTVADPIAGTRVLRVRCMGAPPPEERAEAQAALGPGVDGHGGGDGLVSIDGSGGGGGSAATVAAAAAAAAAQAAATDALFLFLADVPLDEPATLPALRSMFTRLAGSPPPPLLLLMGNFLSHPFGRHPGDAATLSTGLSALGTLLATEFPAMAAATRVVLVPGSGDPGVAATLPRPPLPSAVAAGLVAALAGGAGAELASNPCRLRWGTRTFTVFREDLQRALLRGTATPVAHQRRRRRGSGDADDDDDDDDDGDGHGDQGGEGGEHLGEHVIKTAVDQAHVWPGAAAAGRGVLWTADAGLGLYPAPEVLVLGDAAAPAYRGHYMGTWGVNTGSFGADRSFAVVLPAEGVVQVSRLSDPGAEDDDDNEGEEEEDGGSGRSAEPPPPSRPATAPRAGGMASAADRGPATASDDDVNRSTAVSDGGSAMDSSDAESGESAYAIAMRRAANRRRAVGGAGGSDAEGRAWHTEDEASLTD